MDINKGHESLDIISVGDIQEQVVSVSEKIHSTLVVNANKTKALMKLPPEEDYDREILALAIKLCLAKAFKIALPGKVMMKIKGGTSVKFAVKPLEDLPPLDVVVFLNPQKVQQLLIQGVEPENGINGYSVLVFHWQQESGVLDAHGNIDLKKINKLPGVKAGSLLAKIYQHTNGQPGISCFGERLRQTVGGPIKVEIDGDNVSRSDAVDSTTDMKTYELYAKKGGVVKYSLSKQKNPKTLCYISINDTIVINGDVDYGVGDQGEMSQPGLGCDSNIVVEGSVRGVFTLQSNGFIYVKNAIEGTVSANEVETSFITRGSSVTAQKKITAGSIINAMAVAATIIVQENINGSTLHASEEVIFEKKASCMSLTVNTKKLQAKSTRFSGVSTFIIGEELFCSVEKHSAALKKINIKLNEYTVPLKEVASTIVDHLALLNSIARKGAKNVSPEILQILDKIKVEVVKGFKSVDTSIDESIVPDAYLLQELLGKAKFDESVLRKVDLLLKSIAIYNQKEQEISPTVKEMNFHMGELAELRSQLSNDLVLQFTNIDLLTDSSEVRIYCGEAKQILQKHYTPGESFTFKYNPPEDIEEIRKGKLDILT